MKMTASLGIRRRRPAKRFLRRLVNYLKSDSYMFAPIISSSSKRKYGLSPRERFHVDAAGFEIAGDGESKEEEEEKKKKRLVELIGDYLTSDSYLYAPLIEGESSPQKVDANLTSEGTPCLTKRVTSSIARTALTRKTIHQPTEETSNTIVTGQTEPLFDTNGGDRTPEHGEVLKQVAFPNCWKSLLSEADLPINAVGERGAHRRKIHVE